MKNYCKLLIIAFVLALAGTSCQKDESFEPKGGALGQLNHMPVITYDDVFEQDGKAPSTKKGTADGFSLWYQKYAYNPISKKYSHVGSPVEYPVMYAEYDGTGKLWLQINFNQADLYLNKMVKDGQVFVKYTEAEQMINKRLNGFPIFAFFESEDDANCSTGPNDPIYIGTWRLPTMADVQHLANATKETANAGFEYLYHPEVLNMVQYGWYTTALNPATWGGIGSDCMIWLKADPSWPVPSGYTKSQYPYTILRSCDYITGMGDNYTYLSIADNKSYYNVRLVTDY